MTERRQRPNRSGREAQWPSAEKRAKKGHVLPFTFTHDGAALGLFFYAPPYRLAERAKKGHVLPFTFTHDGAALELFFYALPYRLARHVVAYACSEADFPARFCA